MNGYPASPAPARACPGRGAGARPDRIGILSLSLLLAGCAAMPARDSVVTAAVSPVTQADMARMKPLQQEKVRQAGVTPEDIAAGRLVRVACAVMADGWWSGFAVLPPGLRVANQDVVRVRVRDPGTNDYDGINEVAGPVSPPLSSGQQAYRFIPDWRERGLAKNFERIELPREIRGRYLVVHGAYLVKCAA